MAESVKVGGRFGRSFGWVTLEEVLMPKMGSGDYSKGVQLSTLNELSDELLGGLSGRIFIKLCRETNLDSSSGGGGG